MTLAFTLGLTQGYRRTLFMMAGEMMGVAVVISTTVLLLAWLLALDPIYFQVLSVVGGGYLLWIAWQLWHAEDHFAAGKAGGVLGRRALAVLGFMTAVMNPKGWAFMLALLPSFIDPQLAITPQLAVLLAVMLCTEFLSLSLYASGGKWVGGLLKNDANLKLLNRFAALLMLVVAVLVFV
jgi:threonine/homoserine/homoserine lactone efflux protein